jgi:hypothetical protein
MSASKKHQRSECRCNCEQSSPHGSKRKHRKAQSGSKMLRVRWRLKSRMRSH